MRPIRELLCGVCGLGCLLATCAYAARPVEPPPVVLAALPQAEHAAMRELWRRQGLLLVHQRRFLASRVTPYR